MSFYYNATWKPSMGAYRPSMGHWKAGYGLGAWDESDFTAEQIQRSKDVGAAVETAIIFMDRRVEELRPKSALDTAHLQEMGLAALISTNLKALTATTGWSPAQGLLAVDDDEKIYAIHSGINQVYDSMEGNLLSHADNAVNEATGGRIVSFGDLVDKSGTVYEDYFNAYYIDDQTATDPNQPKQPVVDASGKTKNPKAKKSPIKKGIGIGGALAVASVVGLLGWVGWQAMSKPKWR